MSFIQGNPALVLVRTEYGFDRSTGKFVQKVWEGTQAAVAGGVAGIGNADSYLMSPTGGGAKWQLVARYGQNIEEGGEEVPVREERLRFNQVGKSLYLSPRFENVPRKVKRYIKANVDEADDSGVKRAKVVSDAGAYGLLAGDLWDLISEGATEETVYQPVVTITETASAEFAFNVGFANYGRIFTTAGMISDADLVAGWKSNLPDSTGVLGDSTLYGWLKSPPEIVTAGNNRSQLVQEYTYGRWTTKLYD